MERFVNEYIRENWMSLEMKKYKIVNIKRDFYTMYAVII